MSKTKSKGASKTSVNSNPKYLGVKLSDGQSVAPGMIIVRQRGTKFVAGENTRVGRDHTIYSVKPGKVKFSTKKKTRFDGRKKRIKVVSVGS